MKFPNIEIDIPTFYKWGFFILTSVAVLNTFTLFQNLYSMHFMYVTEILSAFGSLAFNYLIAGFFYYLYSGTKSSISEEQFEDMFKEK